MWPSERYYTLTRNTETQNSVTTLLVGTMVTATLGNSVRASDTKYVIIIWPRCCTPGHLSQRHGKSCLHQGLFIAALFLVARHKKQPSYPSRLFSKQGYISTI